MPYPLAPSHYHCPLLLSPHPDLRSISTFLLHFNTFPPPLPYLPAILTTPTSVSILHNSHSYYITTLLTYSPSIPSPLFCCISTLPLPAALPVPIPLPTLRHSHSYPTHNCPHPPTMYSILTPASLLDSYPIPYSPIHPHYYRIHHTHSHSVSVP